MGTTKSKNLTELKTDLNKPFFGSIHVFQADNVQKVVMGKLLIDGVIRIDFLNVGNDGNIFKFTFRFNESEPQFFSVNKSDNQVTTINSSLKYVIEGSGGDTRIHLTDNVIFHFELWYNRTSVFYMYDVWYPRIEVKLQTTT